MSVASAAKQKLIILLYSFLWLQSFTYIVFPSLSLSLPLTVSIFLSLFLSPIFVVSLFCYSNSTGIWKTNCDYYFDQSIHSDAKEVYLFYYTLSVCDSFEKTPHKL